MNQKDIHKLNTLYKTAIIESKEGSGPPYITFDSEGNKYYCKDQEMTIPHREDGPAIEYANGTREWYIDGKLHRLDGPAIEYVDGSKEWCVNGKRHREDGPAVEYSYGTKSWWIDGKRHREDGPAVEYVDGDRSWWIDGKRHREDGPAVERVDGTKSWWVDGKELAEKEFKAYLANKQYKASHDTTTDFEAFD